MTESIYYVNGQFLPAGQAALPLNDLALVRGYGVFDFLRTYHGRPFHLMDHLERLRHSAAQIDLELPHSIEEIAEIVFETLARSGLPEANIRVIVTGGPSENFFTPSQPAGLIVMVTPISRYPAELYTAGCRVITTRLTRELPTVKSLNYIGAIVAMKAAAAHGAIEALYLDGQEQISEGTRANFFGVRNGRLITPETGILPGITRQVVLRLAHPDIPVERRPLPLAELGALDEAFLTSSTKEIMPVAQVDEQTIGGGTVGPVTRALMARFRAYADQP